MTTTYGLTSTGWVSKPFAVCQTEWQAALRVIYGDDLDLEPESFFGRLCAHAAERESLLWELGEGIVAAFDPDAAPGTLLDSLMALTGALRLAASPSTTTVTLTGVPTTVVAAGKIVSNAGNTASRFDTATSATIAALTAWVGGTSYVIGDRRYNGSNAYVCITAGTAAGSGGPTTTAADITDNTCHWRWLGAGIGAVDVLVSCEVDGPTIALSGALTHIETPVTGWTGAINLLDAVPGRLIESDAAARVRRASLLQSSGNAAADAIRDALLVVDAGTLDPVTSCRVFSNETDATDSNGLPPHSVMALVQGGTDAAIAAALWKSKAGGIATYGTTSVAITDESGLAQTVSFTRPTLKPCYINVINLQIDTALYPVDGDDQVKAAIVAFADAYYQVGTTVRASRLAAECWIPGVLGVTYLAIDWTNSGYLANDLTLGVTELAEFDTSRIQIDHV